MHHASEWFDAWQSECYRTPDLLSETTYQRLFAKCEDWARKKRLEVDTKDNDAMDVGGVDQGAEEGGWPANEEDGYYDDEGNWWEWTTEVSEVGKGKGKRCCSSVLSLRRLWPPSQRLRKPGQFQRA